MSQQINLFNENLHQSGNAFSVLNMLQGLVVVLVLALLFYGYSAFQSMQLAQNLDEVNARLAAEQARLAQLSAEFAKQRSGMTLEMELQKLTSEAAAQREIINALKHGVIGNTKGYSEYMQAFARQTVEGLWLSGFSIDGDARQMSLSGAALSPELVPGYIMRLNKEAAMRGKTFSSLHMQIPREEAGKQAGKQYLEFMLQSVAADEAENSGAAK